MIVSGLEYMQSFMTDTSTRLAPVNPSSVQGQTDTTVTAAQLTPAVQYGSDLVQQYPVQQQHAQNPASVQQLPANIDMADCENSILPSI